MQEHFTTPITYFLQEGQENLKECLKIAFQAARQQNIGKIIIFTARGQGVRLAVETFSSQKEYAHVSVIAVTFPTGKSFTDEEGEPVHVQISGEDIKFFLEHDIPVIRAHLPFDPIASPLRQRSLLGQDLSLVADALNMFCGSMSLCVQAIVVACDAGAVNLGEHVIALTSDTAILARATSTRQMLSKLVIREVLCKPAILTVSRNETPPKLLEEAESVPSAEIKRITKRRLRKRPKARKS